MTVDGPFSKVGLDPEFVREVERRVTVAYLRLQELPSLGLPITEYPPVESRARWQSPAATAHEP